MLGGYDFTLRGQSLRILFGHSGCSLSQRLWFSLTYLKSLRSDLVQYDYRFADI